MELWTSYFTLIRLFVLWSNVVVLENLSKNIFWCNWITEFLVSRVRLKIYVENTRKQLKREEPIPTWYLFNQSSFNEARFLPDWSIELTNFLCFNPWWLGTLGIHVLGFSNVSKLYFSAIIIEEKTCILREVVATLCALCLCTELLLVCRWSMLLWRNLHQLLLQLSCYYVEVNSRIGDLRTLKNAAKKSSPTK